MYICRVAPGIIYYLAHYSLSTFPENIIKIHTFFKLLYIHTYIHTYGQADKQTDRQAGGQTDSVT